MRFVMTAGDCNGVGVEVLTKALAEIGKEFAGIQWAICCNRQTLGDYARVMNLPIEITPEGAVISGVKCEILDCSAYAPVRFGEVSADAGRLALEQLERAIDATCAGEFDAIITLPIAKIALEYAGWEFPGQTEMLAARSGGKPMMILLSGAVRVALATIHIPLADVPARITPERVADSVRQLHSTLRQDFAVPQPRIAVLGLNPHAGESGRIGTEEQTAIIPAIQHVRTEGITADGPFPADGFFAFGEYTRYDGILAMYHDQGLIPLKLLAKGGGVNVTAGLPIVRTSPDHGTAFGIAGRGTADPISTMEAIRTAVEIVRSRRNMSASVM